MSKIYIIGLGSGGLDQMTLGVYQLITRATPLYLRTKEHPAAKELLEKGVGFTSFDELYEAEASFSEVYEQIVISLEKELHRQAGHPIYYAVPGHPLVAERTVQLLLERAPKKGYEVEVVGGQSFLEPLFARLKLDPVEGFQLLDGTCLEAYQLHPALHTVITQVYDARIASEVKLTLMEVYPDEYPVTMATAIGLKEAERIVQLPLYELDRQKLYGNLTCVYIPPTDSEAVLNRQYYRARQIISILRSPEGCPWDRKQTHQSLKKYLLEEAEEVLQAIEAQDPENLKEELGDLLLQIFLHAQIAEEEGYFNMEDVLASLSDKMIRRHPHVFGQERAATPEEVTLLWEKIKERERKEKEEK